MDNTEVPCIFMTSTCSMLRTVWLVVKVFRLRVVPAANVRVSTPAPPLITPPFVESVVCRLVLATVMVSSPSNASNTPVV